MPFFENRSRGLGAGIPRKTAFPVESVHCPYNSVSTTVLHCDSQEFSKREASKDSGSRVNALLEVLSLDFKNYCVKTNTDLGTLVSGIIKFMRYAHCAGAL